MHRISVSVRSIPAKNDRDSPNSERKSWTWNFVTSRPRKLLRKVGATVISKFSCTPLAQSTYVVYFAPIRVIRLIIIPVIDSDTPM